MKLSVFNMHRATGGAPESSAESDSPAAYTGQGAAPYNSLTEALDPNRLRRQTLQRLLIVCALLGGLVYLLGLPGLIEGRRWVELATYGLAVCGVIGLALAQELTYPLRAGGFLVCALLAGVSMLVIGGLPGSGRLLLLVFPMLALFLLVEGRFARLLRVGVFGLSLICLGAVGLLAIQGYFEGYALAAPSNWLAAGLGFGLIGLAAALVFDYHLNGMENRLAQSREALKDLELERQRLENQADWSGRELERRLIQVRTLAEINGAANSLLDVGQLLPRLCELVRERFGLHAVEVFLMDAETQDAYLAAGTGDAGPQKLSEGYRLQVDDESITGWSIGHRQACTDLESDKGEAPLDVARFTNLRLPGGAPKLALPILNQREVLGAMTVHFNAEAVFDQDDFLALKGLADSLAKAIENARLNSEIQSNLDEISSLHRQYLQHAWRQALEASGEREYVYTGKPDASETQANGKEHTATQAHEFSIRLRGQAIGCLSLEVEAERAFNDEERNLIETVIGQAAQALETARLLDETRQRAEQENVAASLSNRIWSSTDVEAILKTALQELGKSLGATEGSIELWPERQPEADLPHDDRLGSRNVLN